MRWGVLTGPRGLRLEVEVAETRRERSRGLLGRTGLEPGRGMLIPWARSVHTFGMRFPLVVVLLDRHLVARRIRRMRPGRLALPRPGIRHVLELDARARAVPGPGDTLAWNGPGDPRARRWAGPASDPTDLRRSTW